MFTQGNSYLLCDGSDLEPTSSKCRLTYTSHYLIYFHNLHTLLPLPKKF